MSHELMLARKGMRLARVALNRRNVWSAKQFMLGAWGNLTRSPRVQRSVVSQCLDIVVQIAILDSDIRMHAARMKAKIDRMPPEWRVVIEAP